MAMPHWPKSIDISPDLNPLHRINYPGTTFERYALTFCLPQTALSEDTKKIIESLMYFRTRFEYEMITEKLAQEDF